MGEQWTINSTASLSAFQKNVENLYSEHRYITFGAPRIGVDRSLDQNALFHVWITEYAAFCFRKDKRDLTIGEKEGVKRIIKKMYTAYNPDSYSFMVFDLVNPLNGQTRKEYTSSKDWKKGEMFQVLCWFQMSAAEQGLILESKGQFAKLQRESNGS